MACAICSKPDVLVENPENAEVCRECRKSSDLHPAVLFRLESGDVHLGLDPEVDANAQLEEITETIPLFLQKSGIAMLRDIDSRMILEGPVNGPNSRLLLFLTDDLPTMIAKALETRQ